MKAFLVRLFIYLCLVTIFTGILTDPLPGSTLSRRIRFFVAVYGVVYGFWTALLEGVYWALRLIIRGAKPSTPDETQPTSDLSKPTK